MLNKKIKNLGLSLLTAGTLLGSSVFGQSLEEKVDSIPEKKGQSYAIIYEGLDPKQPIHPIDRNCGTFESTKVYNSLLEFEVKSKNIYVLLPKKGILKKDTALSKISENLLDNPKISGSNFKMFSNIEKYVEKKLQEEDTLIVFFNLHGSKGFKDSFYPTLKSPDGKRIYPDTLNLLFKNLNKNNNLFIFNSCYAKEFVDSLNIRGSYYASSDTTYGWVDRDFGFGSEYFLALNDKENDFNKDGKVDFEEAYQASSKSYKEKGESKRDFLYGEYIKDLNKESLKKQILDQNKKITFNSYRRIVK